MSRIFFAKIFFLINLFLSFFLTQVVYAECNIEFEWSPNPESYVEGYRIHYGNSQGGPYDHVFDAGSPNPVNGKIIATISGISEGTWYFVVTAYDSEYESEYSDEVSFYCHTDDVENSVPIIGSFSAAPNPADNPRRQIDFTVSASDPDGDDLSYTIDFGDGSSSTSGSTATHAYTAKGTYTAKAMVSDGQGHTVEETIQVTVNDSRPTKVTGVGVQ